MALFGGGALRRQIAALTEKLEKAQADVEQARADKAAAEQQAAEKDDAAKAARQDKKKAEKKLSQIKAAKQSAESKANGLQEKVDHLEKELADFKQAMLDAKRQAERARARVSELEGELSGARRGPAGRSEAPKPEAAPAAEQAPAEAQPERERRPRRSDDARVERLREQLDGMREANKGLKDKVVDAEKAARTAERRRVSDFDKHEAVVRDLQHHLRSERRAYKILQLQYEAQVDRARSARVAAAEAPSGGDEASAN